MTMTSASASMTVVTAMVPNRSASLHKHCYNLNCRTALFKEKLWYRTRGTCLHHQAETKIRNTRTHVASCNIWGSYDTANAVWRHEEFDRDA
jgi:hypothetical protein